MKARELLLFIFVLSLAIPARSEKMDLDTHTLVIRDLESALDGLSSQNSTRYPLMLRLGDLYSDRARLEAMQESERNCQDCVHCLEDRNHALAYYRQALSHLSPDQYESTVLQMGHLYILLGQTSKATKLYLEAARNPRAHSKAFNGEILSSLGEIYYHQAKFPAAHQYFVRALANNATPRRGQVLYRLAWCDLNLGQLGNGIHELKAILETPSLHASAMKPQQPDLTFEEDVSRDLATFYARGIVGSHEIAELTRLSPKNAIHDNLEYLATETDRLGNKPAALFVWRYLMQIDPQAKESIEGHVHMAKIEYDMGHLPASASEQRQAAQLWKASGCAPAEMCADLQSKWRKLVIEWDKAHHKHYSLTMLRSYESYLSLFGSDLEMNYWAAHVARQLKQNSEASFYYRQASELAQASVNSHHSDKSIHMMLEGSLLGEVELAEISRSPKARLDAYNHYLNLDPDGDRNLEIRYQKAKLAYDQSQYADSAQQFHDVAVRRDLRRASLRKQAADLALDSLASLKDNVRLIQWTKEFSSLFPYAKREYGEIGRRALIAYEKDQIVAAEKAHDLKTVDSAANTLLRTPRLTAADREFALGKKVWVAQMRLNFAEAFNLTKKMKTPSLNKAERLLRLAGLADLAGLNAKPYYLAYVKSERNLKKANLVRVKLIRNSRNPWQELARNRRELERTPALMADLSLQLFLRTHDYNRAEVALKSRRLRAQPAGQKLQEYIFLRKINAFNTQIGREQIRHQSQSRLQRDLRRRLATLHMGESLGNQAVRSHDWLMQVVALRSLGQQYDRLAQEIVTFPPPHSLKRWQIARYQQLLSRQAHFYARKSQLITNKLQQFWANSNAINNLVQEYQQAAGQGQMLAAQKVYAVAHVAPPSIASDLIDKVNNAERPPTSHELMLARQAVKEDPFNANNVARLKHLEELAGADVMSVYLEARLDQMQTGVIR